MDAARWTIYCHTHIESGRQYVGQTKKTMMQRWNQHVYTAMQEKVGWSHFANAIRKHGKNAFSHRVLGVCSNIEDSNLVEEVWIFLLETQNPEKGFNFKRGGSHTPHPVKNPWERPGFREKVSSALTGKPLSAEHKSKIGAANLGKKQSPEHVAKCTAPGRVCKPATKELLRQKMTGKKLTPSQRKKSGDANRSRKTKDETRKKLTERALRSWNDPEYVKKNREGSSNPEVKKRIIESNRRRGSHERP